MRNIGFAIAMILAAVPLADASASSDRGYPNTTEIRKLFKPRANEYVVRNNSGGYVAKFAIGMAKMKKQGTKVRFAGRCDSACTMYLGLPGKQTCISKGAYFRFHSPSARSSRTVAAAQRLMMARYPGWVRSWIASKGGLSRSLVTMDYGYASKFIGKCEA